MLLHVLRFGDGREKSSGFLVIFNPVILYHCRSLKLFNFLSVNSAFVACCVNKL